MNPVGSKEQREAYRENKFGLQGNDVWIDGAEMDVALDGLDIAEEIVRLSRVFDDLMDYVGMMECHYWRIAAYGALDETLAKWNTWKGER